MEILDLVKKYNNFDSFNPMQKKVINAGLMKKSIVVSSPTASGKTVIAEIGALNSILNNRKKVIYACPLRALASEHSSDFKKKYFSDLQIKSTLSTGDFDSTGKFLSNNDIIFTTYEKLASLLNHRSDWLSQIGLLIIDEIHSIGSDRGPTLEILTTKLRFLNKDLQILGLSATIPNAKELADWLDAELVESDYRPVILSEGIFFNSEIVFADKNVQLNEIAEPVVSIAIDTLEQGKQALVFANTRKMTESYAKKLAIVTSKRLTDSEKKELEKASEKILSALEQPTLQCQTLASLVKNGVCFHNAGLLQKQREIVEEMFRKNYLKFVCSTTTLAAGVNLPAFRVIIPSPYRYSGQGMVKIPVSEYKQMSGRAGRPKYDSEGQAIMLAKTEVEKDDYFDYYINGEVENCDSKLGFETALRFNLLACIATGFIFDLDSAEKFFSKTFYSKQVKDLSYLFRKITSILKELEGMDFIETSEKRIDATPIGRRVVELYLDPASAYSLINFLSEEKFYDSAYLFSISGVSEMRPFVSPPKAKEAELWEKIQEQKESLSFNVDEQMFYDNDLLPKYWTSQLFGEWISEIKEQAIVDAFKVQPGILRAKLQNADWILYAALELAKILELKQHFVPLNKLRARMKSGIKEELVYLCELRGIGRVRARRMFNSGIKTISDLKKIDVKDLEKILSPKVASSIKQQLSAKK